MKKLWLAAAAAVLLLGGCAGRDSNEYDGNTYRQIKQYMIGTVVDEKAVMISDNGTGTFVGALVGAVLGSTVGRGPGNAIATVGGGLGGAYVGSEVGKANAQELTVKLDDGGDIVVVSKGKDQFVVGDRIKIIKQGNTVERIELLSAGQ